MMHDTDAIRRAVFGAFFGYQLHRFVTPHGLRGTHATLATSAGATAELVAAQLGHASTAVTERHYTAPAATSAAKQQRVLKVLTRGKR